jgi:hypothetical protein
MADAFEEQYLLRMQDRALAARLNRVLAEDAAARPGDADIKLDFVGEGTDFSNNVLVCSSASRDAG